MNVKDSETQRPVIFYDLETTGKAKDTNQIRIIQMTAIKYNNTEDWEEIDRIEELFNNGDVPIEEDAINVHHITHEMVKDKPTFHESAKRIYDFFNGCDVGGYNNSFFDNSVLYLSFIRAGIKWDYRNIKTYDVINLYRKYYNAKLSNVYKLFFGKELEDAHNATKDVEATVEVYKKLKELGRDFDEEDLDHYRHHVDLIGDIKWRWKNENKTEKEFYYGSGIYSGKALEDVGLWYLQWKIDHPERFPLDTVHVCKQMLPWLKKRLEEKEEEVMRELEEKLKEEEKSGKKWYDD